MPVFNSEDGKIPEIDLRRTDHISSIITTFEAKDLKSENVTSFYFDRKTQYVFLELLSSINNKKVVDQIFGYDKEKIISTCKNILAYFENENNRE